MSTATVTRSAAAADFEHSFEEDVEGIEAAGAAPAWLVALRRTAFDAFRRLGLPGRKDEDWLYTDLTPLMQCRFVPAPPPVQAPKGA